jgi:integrase
MSVRKRGKKWAVDIVHDGLIDKNGRLRKSSFRTQKDAKAFEARILSELASGEYQRRVEAQTKHMTFREWWPKYIAVAETMNRPASLTAKRSYWDNHIEPQFGLLHLHEFTTMHANELAITMGEKGLAASTYNHVLSLIQHMLRIAFEWELIPAAPKFKKLSTPGATREEWFTADQVPELLRIADRHGVRLHVLFALRTGVRKGELRAVQWDDIDLERGRLHIRRQVVHTARPTREVWQDFPKGQRNRLVPLGPELTRALAELPRALHNPHVFRGNGERGEFSHQETRNAASAIDGDLAARFYWHKTRHTFASQLVANGVPLNVVQRLGGWSSMAVLQRYAHLAPDGAAMVKAIESLEGTRYIHGTSTAQADFERIEKPL